MYKTLKRLSLFLVLIVILGLMFGGSIALYLRFRGDSVLSEVVGLVNRRIEGVVVVDKVAANILNSYPFVEVNFENVKVYEDSLSYKRENQFLAIQNIKFNINPFKIFKKPLRVASLIFEGVDLDVTRERDGTFNLEKGLKVRNAGGVESKKMEYFDFNIKNLLFEDVNFRYIAERDSLSFNSESVDTEFESSDSLLVLKNSQMKLYNSDFLFNLSCNKYTKQCELNLTLNDGKEQSKGVILYDGGSKIEVKSSIDCSLMLPKFSNGEIYGEVAVDGVIDSEFDIESWKIVNDKSSLKLSLSEVGGNYNNYKLPKVKNGDLFFENSSLKGEDIEVVVGLNSAVVGFDLNNLINFFNNPKNFNSQFTFNLKAERFNPYIMREKLGLIVDTLNGTDDLRELEMSLKFDLSPQNFPPLFNRGTPFFMVELLGYSAKFSEGRDISVESGIFSLFDGNRVEVNDLKGKLYGDNFAVDGDIVVDFNKEETVFSKVDANLRLKSDKLCFDYIFFNEFSFIKSLKSERDSMLDVMLVYGGDGGLNNGLDSSMYSDLVMSDLSLDMQLELFPPTEIPSSSLDHYNLSVSNLITYIDGVDVRINSGVERFKNSIKLKSSQLTYDNIPLQVDGVVWVGDTTKDDTINIKGESVAVEKRHALVAQSVKRSKYPKNIFMNFDFESVDLLGERLHDISGELLVGRYGRSFKFNDVDFDFCGGRVDVSGDLQVKRSLGGNLVRGSDQYLADFDLSYLNVDIGVMNLSGFDKLKEYRGRVDGCVDGRVRGKIIISDLGKINLNATFVDLDFDLRDAKLRGFDPPKSLKRYLRRFNISEIKVDSLSNTLSLTQGVLVVPRMNISSSIGNYFLAGELNVPNDSVSMELEVPLNVVGRAALGVIFGGDSEKKWKVNDSERKRRYVKFFIDGGSDDLKVSLRKEEDK